MSVLKEKPSTVKKMMKPHHSILKLVIERAQAAGLCSRTGQPLAEEQPQAEWTDNLPSKQSSQSHSSSSTPVRGSATATPSGPHYSEPHTHESCADPEQDLGESAHIYSEYLNVDNLHELSLSCRHGA